MFAWPSSETQADMGNEITEEDWFAKRHDQSKGVSGSILRLLYVSCSTRKLAFLYEEI